MGYFQQNISIFCIKIQHVFLQGAGYERRKEDPSPHGRTWVCALLFRSLRVRSFPYKKQKSKKIIILWYAAWIRNGIAEGFANLLARSVIGWEEDSPININCQCNCREKAGVFMHCVRKRTRFLFFKKNIPYLGGTEAWPSTVWTHFCPPSGKTGTMSSKF